jgi:hypothetical protein
MKNIIRNGALALTLAAGAALVAAPTTTVQAKSFQEDGYFGGTWNPIGPRNNRYVKRYHRHYGYYDHGYYAPRYGYYSPRYRYGYYGRPYGYFGGPSVGLSIY